MATKAKSTTKQYPAIGVSGVNIFNGIITGEEYNFELMGRRALAVWDKMRRSDSTTKMSLRVVNEPVKSLTYHIQPASKEAKNLEVSEYVHEQLFVKLRFKTLISEILTYLPMGFAIFERELAYGPVKGIDRLYLSNLSFRKQTSIAKWEEKDGKPGVTQVGPGGKDLPIPLKNLLVFTNEQEGDNYEGQSVFRPAYKHWFYKDKLYQIDAIGHERQGLGVVKIKHPKNATAPQIANAHTAAEDLRASEVGYIDEPDGWDINFMDMQARSLKDTLPSIEHHDRQIAVNMLAGFMNLGSTSGSGSRSVGESQLKLFEQYVKGVADYITDTINRYLIKDLVDLNFNVDEYPTLVAGDVSGESLTVLAGALKNLIDAGFITPTEEDEAYLRGITGLPEKPESDDAEDTTKKLAVKKVKVTDDPADEVDEEVKNASLRDRAKAVLASLRERLYGNKKRSD